MIATTTGRFAKGHSWHLSVNSAGRAHLTIFTLPKPKAREFDITPGQMSELAEVVERERFFTLQGDYGERVPDGSTTTLTIVRGDAARTVSMHHLLNWVRSAAWKLEDPARAVRVLQVVRGWFDDQDAVNLRDYDKKVLEAAGRGG